MKRGRDTVRRVLWVEIGNQQKENYISLLVGVCFCVTNEETVNFGGWGH